MAIKFHLDEHVHPGIAIGLRSRGVDTTTTAECDLIGSDDIQQLGYAFAQQRVMVTHDVDFLKLNAGDTVHAGIAYCHQEKYPIGVLLQMLLLLDACESTQSMKGRIEYL